MDMKKTSNYLTDELNLGPHASSKRKQRPNADLIREAVERYICDEGSRLPSWIGMIEDDDGSLTSANVDEWLRANWHLE